MPTDRFDVQISFEADEGPREIADLLLDTLGGDAATVAAADSITEAQDRVIVRFDEVENEVPPHGREYDPPRGDEPAEAPGREALERLRQLREDSPTVVPIVRALIALSAARRKAGLSPRQRITIEVEPSRVHTQDELRHS